jgi:hypothetical protein
MDARYLQATTVLPRQNKVCGRTLRPFCLRHRVALEAIQSPFLDPEKYQFNPVQVVMAARILSTYDKEEMARPLSFIEKLYVARMSMSKKYYSRCVGIILGCIKMSLSYPKFWKKEDSNKVNKKHEDMPFPLSCVSSLCRNGVSLEEAWTMPEGEAVWMAVASAIYNGAKIDILSTEQEKDLENFDERIEAYKKANNLP